MRLELVIATKNLKKLAEIREILKGLDVRVTSLADYVLTPRIVENGKTFKENALKKALPLARLTGKLTLGEDSGLCVNALGGAPGVYSSRFSGRGKSDPQNNRKLLKALEGVPAFKRRAHYVCAVALADAKGTIGVVEGKCYGRIGFKQEGTFGFGYDPLFIIPRYGLTLARLGPRIKHRISHRFHALKKARVLIEKYIERHRGGCYNEM